MSDAPAAPPSPSSLPPEPLRSPAAPRRMPWLARRLNRLTFRTKFLLIGVALAGPMLLGAGFAAAWFHGQVRAAQRVEGALQQAWALHDLATRVAEHRGLTARIYAGGEETSRQLVDVQGQLREASTRVGALLREVQLPEGAAEAVAGQQREIVALLSLPDADDPWRNFERHSVVIAELLAAAERLGAGVPQTPEAALEQRMVFATLPLLAELLDRQRGVGSAVLTQAQFSVDEMSRYLRVAGAPTALMEQVAADLATVRRLDVSLDRAAGLGNALSQAVAFNGQSIARLLAGANAEDDDGAHYRAGTRALDALETARRQLAEAKAAQAQQRRTESESARALSLAVVGAVLALLLYVYLAFEKSTVLRLRTLNDASDQLSRAEFQQEIEVDGRDEIAQLARRLDHTRVLLMEALSQRAEALAAIQADRAKTDFLARWSHDLRTPLNAVLGFAQLIPERPGSALTTQQQHDLALIRDAAQHQLKLVEDVLDYARSEAHRLRVELGPVPLGEVLADAALLLQASADKAGVPLSLPPSDAVLPWVRADRTRLIQVLVNLLSNAIKFNRAGGRVEVRVRAADDRADEAMVEIEDTGIGMAEDALDRVFEPFERLDTGERRIEGAGLGLALAKRLTELMGGRLTVRSTPGVGTCFSLGLARVEAPAAALAVASSPRVEPLPLQGRVAYVEDDPVNALLVMEWLRLRSSLSLEVFPTAAEARAAAGQEVFDLWIIDRQLPDGDGIALLGQLREARGGDIPAVVLSADALEEFREQARDAGFKGYWTKPIDLDHLLQRIGEALAPSPPRQ